MFIGIDTSNYTSSSAVYDDANDVFYSKKQLLPVTDGQLGLRQSDAVFHHVKNLPPLLSELCGKFSGCISAVGFSHAPRDVDGSYMPCFSVGEGFANVLSATLNVNNYSFSHQAGHIAAAVWSAKQTHLVNEKFIAFHVSGGTTDVLLVQPDSDNIFNIEMLASSLDLKAGQAIDRAGVMLGLHFPAGAALDKLSLMSDKVYKTHPYMRDGSVSFSGLENKCRQMLDNGEQREDIAKFCISYVCTAIENMTEYALNKCGDLPVIYAGGVMSNTIINNTLSKKFGGYFAEPYYSSDNAAGIAYLTYLKEKRK